MTALATAPTRRSVFALMASAAAAAAAAPTMANAIPASSADAAAWDAAMAAFTQARLDVAAVDAQFDPDRYEQICERAYRAELYLMDLPAPHHEALLWKLQTVLVIDSDDFTGSWSRSFVAQTIDDMNRLLGSDAVVKR